MTKKYETETGYYVLKDAEGRVIANANVSPGQHRVSDDVDLSESYDVGSPDDFEPVDRFYKY